MGRKLKRKLLHQAFLVVALVTLPLGAASQVEVIVDADALGKAVDAIQDRITNDVGVAVVGITRCPSFYCGEMANLPGVVQPLGPAASEVVASSLRRGGRTVAVCRDPPRRAAKDSCYGPARWILQLSPVLVDRAEVGTVHVSMSRRATPDDERGHLEDHRVRLRQVDGEWVVVDVELVGIT